MRPVQRAMAWALTLVMLGAALAIAPVARAADGGIVRPPELERDVNFWIRVYTQVTTNEGYIHDERNLGVIYEKVSFGTATPQQRRAQVDAARDRHVAILEKLATGATTGLSTEQERIRQLFGDEGSPARFRQAQDEVRFQLGQSDRFRAGLVRSAQWEPHIADTLANMGLPPEIAALPHVESSFDPTAYSKVGAAGLWQFMRGTGRRFLRIDDAVDERMDPFRASEAAAQLLDYNYRLLGSWPLALTAYNHGAGGMRRARDSLGTTDIAKIVRNYKSPLFGFASRNFYVSFLAALEIDRNPEKYFGQLQRAPEQRFHELAMPSFVPAAALLRVVKVDRERLEQLNPALRSTVWKGQRMVPRGYKLRLPAEASEWTSELLAARLGGGEQFAGQPKPRSYRIRKGDTIASIAAANSVAPLELARMNTLKANSTLRVGRSLLLPETSPQLASVAAPAAAEAKKADAAVYVVRAGDALAEIARRTSVSEQTLMALNQLRDRDHVYEGQRLRLTAEGAQQPDATVAVASVAGPAAVAASTALLSEKRAETRVAVASATKPEPKQEVVSAAQAQEQSPALLPGNPVAQSSDVIEYGVAADGSIRVVAAETLGHYADWLGISAARLREVNGLKFGTPVIIGRPLKLDFTKVKQDEFERLRREYHQKLQAAFFAEHRILGTEVYVVRRGDSLWAVTQRYANLPVWLLQQYNPDLDFGDLKPGSRVTVPRVEEVPSL